MLQIFIDSDCDMTLEEAESYGLHMISMPYELCGEVVYPYTKERTFDFHKFYDTLRAGNLPTTFALNPEQYVEIFEPYFKNGDDIIYASFSHAMSGTFNSLNLAIEELTEKYPGVKFDCLDSKGICTCGYLFIREIAMLYKDGATREEIIKWAEENVDKCATYFYADDLKFFAKSGRVSNFAAFMGGIIGIKPIIYMDEKGTMTSLTKAKGKKNALNKILDYVDELKLDWDKHPILIANTDCMDLAKEFEVMVKERFGQDLNIEHITCNPTAGGHCGPDCIGIAFHAIHK